MTLDLCGTRIEDLDPLAFGGFAAGVSRSAAQAAARGESASAGCAVGRGAIVCGDGGRRGRGVSW